MLAFNFLLTYLGLKLLVEIVGFYPTPSKMIITVVTTVVGFLIQKYFSFRVNK
jgi:putative flippase GtrA